MHLRQSRIRNTNKLLNDVEKNLTFFIGVNLNEITLKIIQRKLNITKINKKETVFPTPFNGIMSERNSVGEFIPQKINLRRLLIAHSLGKLRIGVEILIQVHLTFHIQGIPDYL